MSTFVKELKLFAKRMKKKQRLLGANNPYEVESGLPEYKMHELPQHSCEYEGRQLSDYKWR